MKITPIAQGTNLGAVSMDTAPQVRTPDKVARAKAIAAGQEVPQGTSEQLVRETPIQPNIKKIKMRTNVSPDREIIPNDEIDVTNDAQSPISHTSEEPVDEPIATGTIDPEKAAIVKAKRFLQAKERELDQREEALKGQSPLNKEDYISKADLKTSPLKTLLNMGVTYDQLTQEVLSDQSHDSIDVKSFKDEVRKELTEEFSRRDQQAKAQVLAAYKSDVDALVADNPEYQIIKTEKLNAKVVKLIDQVWEKEGKALSVEEAANIIETQRLTELTEVAKLEKVQNLIAPRAEQRQLPPPQRTIRTLTNRDGATSNMGRRERAIAAFTGALKRG